MLDEWGTLICNNNLSPRFLVKDLWWDHTNKCFHPLETLLAHSTGLFPGLHEGQTLLQIPQTRHTLWHVAKIVSGREGWLLISYFKSWRIALLPFEHLEEAFQVAGWQHEKMCQKFLRCIQDPLLSVSRAPRPKTLYPAHQMSSWDWSPSWMNEDSFWAGGYYSSQIARIEVR